MVSAKIFVSTVAVASAGCSGSADPVISGDTCYSGSAGALGLKETVTVTVHDFSSGTGHADIIGSGIEDIKCTGKTITKSGQDLNTDLTDCLPSAVAITALQYCSDDDTIKVTVKDKSVPLPVSATLKKTACGSVSNGMEEMWSDYKAAYGVNGDDQKETFAANVKKAVENNRLDNGMFMGVEGPFAAMTLEEFQAANIRGFVSAKSQGLPNLGMHEDAAAEADTLTGKYSGSVPFIIDVESTFNGDATADVLVDVKVASKKFDCKAEPITETDSLVSFKNAAQTGDCLGDAVRTDGKDPTKYTISKNDDGETLTFHSDGYPDLKLKKSSLAVAATIDWTTKGAVTPVKNQGQCGSCWSFSTTGGLEGAWQLSSGNLVSMSEQQFVDCDTGSSGCNGGSMEQAFQWSESTAVATESSYPYTAKDGSCKSSFTTAIPSGGVTGYKQVGTSASSLTSAIQNAPVSVAIEADQSAFQLYTSGVITSGCGSNLDHGVLAVGVNSDGSIKVKNSWGTSWGANGFVNIATSQCGITQDASYPVVSSSVSV